MSIKIKQAPAKEKTKRKRVGFYLDAPNAQHVFLAGDFNDWEISKHPMKRSAGGIWQKITVLYPGRYEYKFLVDGHWRIDPANDRTKWNCYGSQNSVIDVEAK
jgi:1,4-alpha-glucan branching enzyme